MTAGQQPGTGPGAEGNERPLSDQLEPARVLDRQRVFQGRIWDVVADRVDLGEHGQVRREYVEHTSAVAVMVLDEQDRVLLLNQYRHPVRMRLWELPAGLLDNPGEDPLVAARRELAEEADLQADSWSVLIDWLSSPGGSDEALRVYLARGVREVPADERHERRDEEAGIELRWVPLAQALDAVLGGRVHNVAAVVAILAAVHHQGRGWTDLRPADAPWPELPTTRRGD